MKETSGQPSKSKQTIGLIVSIAICFAAAGIGGAATTSSLADWYANLNKPSWNPPNWIFGPVWTALYLMMAVAAWQVWRKVGLETGKTAFALFAIQLGLNVIWSVLFFGRQQPGWAFIDIIFLWLAIGLTIGFFARHSKIAALLMLPYLLWVSFAAVLNYAIWSMNG